MKKLFIICIFMTTAFTINAQTLKGSCYDDGQGTNSWFTQVDINTTFSFYAKNNMVYIKCSNLKMNVPSNTTYNAYGQTYTKSDLGISQWPQNQKPWSMTINVSGSYNGGNFNKSIFCSVNFTCDEFHIEGIKADQVNISSFRINSILNVRYNQGGDPQLEEIIKQKNKQKSQTTNTYNTTSQNSGSTNPLGTSQTSTTQTNSSSPSLESQYAKLGIPENTPTYTKQEVTNQVVTQAGNLASELINEHNANYDKKMARWQAESDANTKALWEEDYRKGEIKFKKEYLLIMEQAINGNEDARMELYFASEKFYFKKQVPERDKWFLQAVNNKNCSALLKVVDKSYTYTNEDISGLEYLASLGCVDAMVHLADWYDKTNVRIWGQNARGGENEQKAIEWFTIAANNGSPNAMYCLGMIYKYGTTQSNRTENMYKRMHLKYSVKKNEKLAFEWFTKSLQPDYKSSSFAKFDYHAYYKDSEFDSGVYEELYKMYKEGKVVVKNKEKAQEFKNKIDK